MSHLDRLKDLIAQHDRGLITEAELWIHIFALADEAVEV